MTAIDTNVLFYAHDRSDQRKMRIASGVIESLDDGVLLWQSHANTSGQAANWRLKTTHTVTLWRTSRISDRVGTRFCQCGAFWGGFPHSDREVSPIGTRCWSERASNRAFNGFFPEDFREIRRVDSLEILNPFEAD
jgi:predicted nucleic acid-binding protein